MTRVQRKNTSSDHKDKNKNLRYLEWNTMDQWTAKKSWLNDNKNFKDQQLDGKKWGAVSNKTERGHW